MGKRKSRMSKLLPRKVQPKLEVVFTCPFYDHKSVKCHLDMKLRVGEAKCWTCKETYATTIHGLIEPIDIYSEWIDECEKAKKEQEQEEEDLLPKKKLRIDKEV